MDASRPLELASAVDTGRIIGIIVFLILLILGAYFLTKYIERRTLRRGTKQEPRKRSFFGFAASGSASQFGTMVTVVDRIALDREKSLMVVEFEDKYYLIGVTPQGFECIDKVDMPAPEHPPEAPERDQSRPEEMHDAAPASRSDFQAGSFPQDAAGSTFGERFRHAFGIVLRSYLPKSMRSATRSSFDDELQAQMRRNASKDEKKEGPPSE